MGHNALIVGAGTGISASFARVLSREGASVALAARNTEKLAGLAAEIDGEVIACDATSEDDVNALFSKIDTLFERLDIVLYNPSARVRKPLLETSAAEVRKAFDVTAFGAFLVGREAASRMVDSGGGTILFTGATASIKGFAKSATFAMGKFALRGLAQSMAREFGPHGIHVAHFIIDGGVRVPGREHPRSGDIDAYLDPDAIAETYLHVVNQDPSAWTFELDIRPSVESF